MLNATQQNISAHTSITGQPGSLAQYGQSSGAEVQDRDMHAFCTCQFDYRHQVTCSAELSTSMIVDHILRIGHFRASTQNSKHVCTDQEPAHGHEGAGSCTRSICLIGARHGGCMDSGDLLWAASRASPKCRESGTCGRDHTMVPVELLFSTNHGRISINQMTRLHRLTQVWCGKASTRSDRDRSGLEGRLRLDVERKGRGGLPMCMGDEPWGMKEGSGDHSGDCTIMCMYMNSVYHVYCTCHSHFLPSCTVQCSIDLNTPDQGRQWRRMSMDPHAIPTVEGESHQDMLANIEAMVANLN